MKHLLIILSSLFYAILFIVILCIETATAQEPFIISSESLERIPPKHLNFLEWFDKDIPLETLENAEWTETLMSAQSMVEGVLGAVCGEKQPCHQQHRSDAQR